MIAFDGPAEVEINPVTGGPARLHKGGRHKANALAAKAARDAAASAAKDRALAERTAAQEAGIAAQQLAQQKEMSATNAKLLETLTNKAPLTQLIDDRKKKGRKSFGLVATRTRSATAQGLGGLLGKLGNQS